MTPGQFGPINLELLWSSIFLTYNISFTGIPSEIQTITSISEYIDSIIASAVATNVKDWVMISSFSLISHSIMK